VPLRVLLVTSEFPPDIGGIGSHVAELARGLSNVIDRVSVVYPRDLLKPATIWPVEGFRGAVERPRVIKGEPFYQLMLHRRLVRAVSDEAFNLVHVHGMRPLGATRGLPVPTVFTNHSSGFLARLNASPRRKERTSQELQHVAQLIAPSDELVEAARALGYAGPATMIPNGVDPERFKPDGPSRRASLGIRDDEVVILLARRLVEKNGVVWFARAVDRLRGSPVRIVVAGDGGERPAMEKILSENGMLDRTIFLGSVSNADMPALFRAADISVLPSLAEATSIAGLEAMASGVALVGTSVGGIPAIIEDNATGLLIPPRDPEAMGAALARLVVDQALRRQMGAAARAKVEREFTWTQVVRRTIDVYRASLGAAHP
jgi:glycosyltransferase involved in cell wall biosynthesis